MDAVHATVGVACVAGRVAAGAGAVVGVVLCVGVGAQARVSVSSEAAAPHLIGAAPACA